MFRLSLLCILFVSVNSYTCLSSSGQPDPENTTLSSNDWKPSTVNGIIVGSSSYDDIVRLWGPPFSETEFASDPYEPDPGEKLPESLTELWYRGVEIDGENVNASVLVGDKTKIVRTISYSQEDLTKERAIAKFGTGFFINSGGESACGSEGHRNWREIESVEFPVVLVYPKKGLKVQVREDGAVIQLFYPATCN